MIQTRRDFRRGPDGWPILSRFAFCEMMGFDVFSTPLLIYTLRSAARGPAAARNQLFHSLPSTYSSARRARLRKRTALLSDVPGGTDATRAQGMFGGADVLCAFNLSMLS